MREPITTRVTTMIGNRTKNTLVGMAATVFLVLFILVSGLAHMLLAAIQ